MVVLNFMFRSQLHGIGNNTVQQFQISMSLYKSTHSCMYRTVPYYTVQYGTVHSVLGPERYTHISQEHFSRPITIHPYLQRVKFVRNKKPRTMLRVQCWGV